eukprot:TRINITY_DN9731_c0_g1_i2.p1 TRINITY_DN9731_c0_g1~~TRINITY_DN9731_c0_g1_i2.p1  ORF type:complete len:680 (+),score=238.80 TRINITY_DN9731_c0_g1_i2:90-2129(+)
MQLRKCVVALFSLAAVGNAAESRVTPIQKVIQLMAKMTEKGRAEKEAEQVQFAKFKQFCTMTLAEKEKAISEAADLMEQLDASIEKNAEDADNLAYEITLIQKDVEKAAAEQEKATKVRNDERAAYKVTLKDYSESIDALGRALDVLKKQDYDRKQAAFIQLKSLKLIPEDVKSKLVSFLQTDAESESDSFDPVADGYEFQSGGIIEMLADLQTKFGKKRVLLEKEEASSQQAFTMLVQGLENTQRVSKKEIAEKKDFKSKKLEKKASDEADFSETKGSKAADQKYKDDLQTTCEKKEADFKDRQHMRQEELDAIGKAVEIIKSGDVAGVEPDRSFLQTGSSTSLAGLRTTTSTDAAIRDVKEKVAMFLQNKGGAHTAAFAHLIARIQNMAPSNAALQKVADMIQGLITSLNEKAQAEATKKGYCDKELKVNGQTRKEKSESVESSTADIDELTAEITTLAEEIETASKESGELQKAMKDATELRQTEKLNNTATIKDAKAAQKAVASAITVLNEFYAKAAGATAFVQTETRRYHHAQPEIFDETPYTGMGGAKGGVVTMMQLIEEDFARVEAQTQGAEKAAAAEFDQFMSDSKVDKTKKDKDVEFKTAKSSEKSQEKKALEQDLLAAQKELDAANLYYDKLKAQCLSAGKNYEERQESRKQEINDLTAALDLLNSLAN